MVSHPPFNLATTLGRVLAPFGLGYFLSYLFRTVNAVVGPEVASSLGLSAAQIGLVTSAYFISFAAFQIPLGVLLDRYGARRVEAALLLVAAVGATVFALSSSTGTLALGRSLIGLGVSSCLMAAMKANAQWWPPERLALANGTTLAIGGLGALVATAPVQAVLAHTDWRGIFWLLATLTVTASALIMLVVPKAPARPPGEGWWPAFRGAVAVFRSPAFLAVAPHAAISQATVLAYHGLWAAEWLREAGGLDPSQTGAALALATTGLILGTFTMGIAADQLTRIGIRPATVIAAGSAAFLLVQLGLVLRVPVALSAMWLAFVFFGTSSTLSFTILAQSFPRHLTGRANTALNMLIFSTAFLLQWLVGVLLGFWPRADGQAQAEAHAGVLACVLALQALAFTWFLVSSWGGSRKRHIPD